MKKIKIQKKSLELVYKTLNKTVLSFADARIRDAFIKHVKALTLEYYKQRQDIYKELCIKKDKKPVIKDGHYEFDPKNVDKVNKEINILNAEYVEVMGDTKVLQIIQKTSYEFSAGEAEQLDEFINQV